jgi:hypothetical protein
MSETSGLLIFAVSSSRTGPCTPGPGCWIFGKAAIGGALSLANLGTARADAFTSCFRDSVDIRALACRVAVITNVAERSTGAGAPWRSRRRHSVRGSQPVRIVGCHTRRPLNRRGSGRSRTVTGECAVGSFVPAGEHTTTRRTRAFEPRDEAGRRTGRMTVVVGSRWVGAYNGLPRKASSASHVAP